MNEVEGVISKNFMKDHAEFTSVEDLWQPKSYKPATRGLLETRIIPIMCDAMTNANDLLAYHGPQP